jgi:hypothetical protein
MCVGRRVIGFDSKARIRSFVLAKKIYAGSSVNILEDRYLGTDERCVAPERHIQLLEICVRQELLRVQGRDQIVIKRQLG